MNAVDLLDTSRLEQKVAMLLEVVNEGEINTWKNHPCTKALMLGLLIDEANIMEQWKNGAYGTRDEEQKALGHLRALQQLKEFFAEEIAIDKDDWSQGID